MAEAGESLTSEQERVLSEVEEMVLSAISARCAGCSTANFAPRRFGMAVARDRVSKDIAVQAAQRFNACAGLFEENGTDLCHYPPPPK